MTSKKKFPTELQVRLRRNFYLQTEHFSENSNSALMEVTISREQFGDVKKKNSQPNSKFGYVATWFQFFFLTELEFGYVVIFLSKPNFSL